MSQTINFFSKIINNLNCNQITKSYIVGVFDNFKKPSFDYSNQSITVIYAEAKFNQDFHTFQNIGDYLLFVRSMFPEHLNNASEEYYCNIARLSYYACYKLINRKWHLYEEIADKFIDLSDDIRAKILEI